MFIFIFKGFLVLYNINYVKLLFILTVLQYNDQKGSATVYNCCNKEMYRRHNCLTDYYLFKH